MSKEKKEKKLKREITFLKYSVGNDISKDKFDACISCIDTMQYVKVIGARSFSNTKKGIDSYLEWVKNKCKLDLPIVHSMEATGVYYEKLAWSLHRSKKSLSVILPNKAKKYMQSLGIKTKNDKIDAKGLSRMGAEQNLPLWEAPDKNMMKLRSVTRQREHLQETKTMTNNQLHALKSGEYVNEELQEQLKTILYMLDQQIKETLKMIEKHVNSDDELKRKIENITVIKGLGLISVATVIAETNGFKLFNNQRQLVSFAGYDVIENQSGKHVGKTKISKRGNTHIRRILHMPSFSVVTHNEPVFKNLQKRVFDRTKKKMKGYVAVQRKLLVMIYTLWRKDEKYEKKYPTTIQGKHPEMQSKSPSFRSVA
ncbi:MAG: IS110 family transposase [Bacteroidales bacterium]|nr:IS110 family transposase [Bacteroidales bacterium]